MLVNGALRLASFDTLNPMNPNYDSELNQWLGIPLWISIPLGGSFIYAGPFPVLVLAAYNYVTAFFVLRGSYRSYEMIFGALAIGFASGFFIPFFFFLTGLYPIFVNIVWIFYLRRDDVKMYFHRKI